MDDIVGLMKKVAAHEARRLFTTELGVVTEAFPHADDGDNDNYECSVKLLNKKQPDGSDFVLKKVPVAVPYVGWACVPNKDELVLLQFIGGDLNAPVITGRLYTDALRPPANKAGEFVLRHKADGAGTVKLDEDGKITVASPNEKNVITIEDDLISLVGDQYSLVIDVSGGKISITSDKDLELVAKKGKCLIDVKELEIKTSGPAKVESQGELTIKGSTVQAEASGPLKIKGATIDLN